MTQFETHATGIKTDICEWEYEGVFMTQLGWFGLFDYEAIKKIDLKQITKDHDLINHYRYGVYFDIGMSGQYEVNVCRDVKDQIIGVKVVFSK